MLRHCLCALFAVGITSSVFAVPAVTGAVSWEGQLSSGDSLDLHAQESNDDRFLYFESTTTLSSGLALDVVAPGLPSGLVLPAGVKVQSYLLHFDPVGAIPGTTISGGSITFDGPIIGLLINDASLNATDSVLGVAGATYFTGVGRGMDVGVDQFIISADALTLDLGTWTAGPAVDELRVITALPPALVPESSISVALLGIGLAFLAFARRGFCHH